MHRQKMEECIANRYGSKVLWDLAEWTFNGRKSEETGG